MDGAARAIGNVQFVGVQLAREIPSSAILPLSAIAVAEKDMEAVACAGLENVETE